MKKIITTLVVAIVATTSTTYAQYTSDALRFSQTNYGSTARFKGLGGAQIGVGGDMSSLGGNPAGLGLFTKSEFSLTPEFNQNMANALFLGQNTKTNKSQLNLNQLGLVFYAPTYKPKGQDTKKGLISTVFGIGYNRNNDFSAETNYMGTNNSSSIIDSFAENAGSTAPNGLAGSSIEALAYDNFLMSYDDVTKSYYPETYASSTVPNNQRRNLLRSGSTSEFNFAAAANISNQVYIGASIGLVDIRYNSDAQFEESGKAREYNVNGDPTGNVSNYRFLFNVNQITKGSGINGRLGIVLRPTSEFRIGATLQTPTWMVIDDSTTEGLDNRATARGTQGSKTYDFTYNLRTPLKGSFGASYVIAGQALISADIDFVDYASMRFSTSSNYGSSDDVTTINNNNMAIRNNYKSAVNYRIGAEYKVSTVSLRAGYALNGSPYKDKDFGATDMKIYSGGIGYRASNYYLDLAYQRVEDTNNFSPYSLSTGTEPYANVKNAKNNVFLTLGLRF